VKDYILNILNSFQYRAFELAFLSLIIPFSIAYWKLGPYLLIFLWVAFAYCLFIYYFCERKNIKKKNRPIFKRKFILFMLIRWIILSLLLYIFTSTIFPERLFSIQNSNPDIMWKILIFYPIISALPQEFIFCKFFFSRYKKFFGEKTLMVFMSALVFCISHILFVNWVAPVLGLAAGILFAITYQKTKSLILVSIEHGLYGDVLFFIGLGWFFWGGSIN
tara:strand:- start:3113 stop:3772 length:660 start_codon:yes stop_codon:yes gene_type:complete